MGGACFAAAFAAFALCLAEAMIRWDAMAGPVRIIIRLVGYGKLTFREVIDAVMPDIAALLYPLWVGLGAVCAFACLFAVLRRTGGLFAGMAALACGAATLLSDAGSALFWPRAARGSLLMMTACLFAVRWLLSRPGRTKRPPADAGGQGEKLFPPGSGERAEDERTRLFAAPERQRLFDKEEKRRALFPGRDRGRSGGKKENGG